MALTLDNPTAEAKLKAFADARGLTTAEALIEAIDALDGDEPGTLEGIPACLIAPDADILLRSQTSLDNGLGIDGETFLAALRKPLSRP